MKSKTFDVKSFWKEMKKLFPEIDVSNIKEDAKQWSTTTGQIVLKRLS